jgi:hypothetical protein
VKKAMCVMFVATLAAALMPAATAQDSPSTPPMSLAEKVAIPAVPGQAAVMKDDWNPNTKPPNPFFCTPGNCLLYSGDTDVTSPYNNGLYNFNNVGLATDGEVYFSFKGTKASVATGIYGNYFTNATAVGTNPTPVEFRVGVSSGNGGKVVCQTTGTAVYSQYGTGNFGLNSINYWVKKIARPCKLAAKTEYYAEVQPQYNNTSTIGYLEDNDTGSTGNSPPKHACSANGFKATPNNSFFSSTSGSLNFVPTSGSGNICGNGTHGCRGFSWGFNGKASNLVCK